jgi:hypothetical protein
MTGTAGSVEYQKKTAGSSTTTAGRGHRRRDRWVKAGVLLRVVPDAVSVAIDEIGADVREGLLAVGASESYPSSLTSLTSTEMSPQGDGADAGCHPHAAARAVLLMPGIAESGGR